MPINVCGVCLCPLDSEGRCSCGELPEECTCVSEFFDDLVDKRHWADWDDSDMEEERYFWDRN